MTDITNGQMDKETLAHIKALELKVAQLDARTSIMPDKPVPPTADEWNDHLAAEKIRRREDVKIMNLSAQLMRDRERLVALTVSVPEV